MNDTMATGSEAGTGTGTGLEWIMQQQDEQADRLPPVRYSGVLAHPTSLPGPHGIGDLGEDAYRFVEWLVAAKQSLWQILPLGPTGYGDSPYQAYSAFAGNPLMVSLVKLAKDGLLDDSDLANEGFPERSVDFETVTAFKMERLRRAGERFRDGGGQHLRAEYDRFCAEQAAWLDDYALFMALREDNGHQPWTEWPDALRMRRKPSLAAAARRLTTAVDLQRFMQFAFFRQWHALKRYANERGVSVFGDIPIFVALDSSDVWANKDQFQIDKEGKPTVVAGVPPDYFSATGQLWGNPLYDWRRMKRNGYAWWIERFRAVYQLVDIARIDHFRGFESYWAVPAGEETAINGEWRPGPGKDLFDAVRAALGDLPVVAEDLGMITKAVDDLREALGFPGMSVLQFAFGSGPENLYLPHNLPRSTVVYTGTHDNDTTRGWYAQTDEKTRHHARIYLNVSGDDIAWDLIRAAWRSVSETAIAQLQDILDLGAESRMNLPGRPVGNWGWRLRSGALTGEHAARLAEVTELYGRLGRWQEDQPPA